MFKNLAWLTLGCSCCMKLEIFQNNWKHHSTTSNSQLVVITFSLASITIWSIQSQKNCITREIHYKAPLLHRSLSITTSAINNNWPFRRWHPTESQQKGGWYLKSARAGIIIRRNVLISLIKPTLMKASEKYRFKRDRAVTPSWLTLLWIAWIRNLFGSVL